MSSKSDSLPIVVYQPKRYMDKRTVSQIRSHAQKTVQHRKVSAETKTELADFADNQHRHTPSSSPSLPLLMQHLPARDQVFSRHLRASHLGLISLSTESMMDFELARCPVRISTDFPGSVACSRDLFPTQPNALFMHLVDRSYGIWEWNQRREDFVRSTLKEGGIYHSLLALAYHVYHQQTRKAIYHENAAINYVSQQLSQSTAYTDNIAVWNTLVWCVCRLVLIAYERRDVEAVSSHLNGVVTMLKCSPIFGPMEAWPQWQTVVGGVLLPSLSRWHTLPLALQNIPSYIRTTACEDVRLIGYTVDTTWLTDERAALEILSPKMVDILQAFRTICTQPRPNTTTSSRQPISFARHAVRLALRAIQIDVDQKYMESSHGTALQECLCLTIVVIGWESSYPILASSTAIGDCRARARTLLSKDSSFDVIKPHRYRKVSEGLFVWILVMMGATSQESAEQSCYVRILCNRFSHFTNQNLTELERMTDMVGWCKQHFGKRVELFWRLVQQKSVENTLRFFDRDNN